MRNTMNKEELVQKAREALLRGEREVEGHYIYTAKIDLDVGLDSARKWIWETTRKLMLEWYTKNVVFDINTVDTERGCHTTINYLSKLELTDEIQNFIQLLLGDDIVRYKINQRRIEKGISWEQANILFSQVLDRYATTDDTKLKIALERIVGEMK